MSIVIPELNGKLDGCTTRSNSPTGSVTELVAVLEKNVTVDGMNAYIKAVKRESRLHRRSNRIFRDIVYVLRGSLFDASN